MSATFRWEPPSRSNGVVRGYEAQCWAVGFGSTPVKQSACADARLSPLYTQLMLKDLEPASTYFFQVTPAPLIITSHSPLLDELRNTDFLLTSSHHWATPISRGRYVFGNGIIWLGVLTTRVTYPFERNCGKCLVLIQIQVFRITDMPINLHVWVFFTMFTNLLVLRGKKLQRKTLYNELNFRFISGPSIYRRRLWTILWNGFRFIWWNQPNPESDDIFTRIN